MGDGLRLRRFLSLGGGVQSSTLALMADRGCFDTQPEAAVFADTQWEPPETYAMVEWLSENLTYPVYVVSAGSLSEHLSKGTTREGSPAFVPIPTFTITERPHRRAKTGMSLRVCTSEFKITPTRRKIRELIGVGQTERIPAGLQVEQWLGMSSDEIGRMKDSDVGWITNVYPLIAADMSRRDCLQWWIDNAPSDAPRPAKSSCVGCPYHSSVHWAQLDRAHPELIVEAAEVEQRMQQAALRADPHVTHYLHRRRIPLAAAVARDRIEVANRDAQGTLFGDPLLEECDGFCWT